MHGLRETGVSELRPTTRHGTQQEILDALRALPIPTTYEGVVESGEDEVAGSLPSVEPAPADERYESSEWVWSMEW